MYVHGGGGGLYDWVLIVDEYEGAPSRGGLEVGHQEIGTALV
jgi:hypothetical protein